MPSKEKPYVLYVAELIYSEVCEIKKKNPYLNNVDAIEAFIGSDTYTHVSSGKFHDEWFEKLKKNKFIDSKTKKKIPDETIRLLQVQKDAVIKQLIKFPDLYFAKSHYPLELSQRAYDHLWRMCESFELWCRETKQEKLIILNIID
mgnify:FL=1|tara:strand:+ start:74 stop:511 length:438 start_codon:yes stop_codon:yes gene_type:complete